MAEGEEPPEPEEEVERGGKERKAHDLHREDRIDDERQGNEDDEEGGEDRDLDRRHAGAGGGIGAGGLQGNGGVRRLVRHQAAFPNSPSGLMRSTIAITTKITTAEPCG